MANNPNFGINLDPLNPPGRPPADQINRFGWARVVARLDSSVGDYIGELQGAGIKVLLVLTSDSFPSATPGSAETRDRARQLADSFNPDAWQVGNEADGGFDPSGQLDNSVAARSQRAPSSWCMEPEDLFNLTRRCSEEIRSVQSTATIVTAGMASGSPDWLQMTNLFSSSVHVDGVAVHPYGQRPAFNGFDATPGNFGFVGNLLDNYRVFGRPLWVTETGLTVNEVPLPTVEQRERFQADYCLAMMDHLQSRPDVEAGFWFCYSDGMVPEFGLVRADGSPRPAFDAVPH